MAIMMRAKSSIFGLNTSLQQLAADISAEQVARSAADGELSSLTTVVKSDLVSAINEVVVTAAAGATASLQIAANLSDLADAAVARTNLDVYSKSEVTAAVSTASSDLQAQVDSLDSATLKKAANLADLVDVAAARTNLAVMSATQVAGAIEAAKLALGTNYTVDTLVERDALVGLDEGDRVLVRDATGAGEWVLYKPRDFVEGMPTAWLTLSSKVSFEATSSKEAIKAAYESNANTNAFTDAEQVKLAGVEAGAQVNTVDSVNGEFGAVVLTADDIGRGVSTVDADLIALETEAARLESVKADISYVDSEIVSAKAYADEAARLGGSRTVMQTVTVVGSTITLANAPKDGLGSVLNFAMVRHVDVNGVAYDAPLIGTADTKQFVVSTDTADQWDGFSVMVQYIYVDAA